MARTNTPKVLAALVAATLVAALALALPASPAWAATLTVTKTADTNDGACTATDCSLRESIVAANASAEDDEITLPAGTYTLTIAGRDEDAAATGDLDIADGLTITGAGARDTIIDGGATDRVLDILPGGCSSCPGAAVSISDVAITGGNATSFEGSGGGYGGGIDNSGTLMLTDSAVKDNQAEGQAGGISNAAGASLTATNSTFSGNRANQGGAIYNGTNNTRGSGSVTLINSTVSDNEALGENSAGGGIAGVGNETLTNITLASNMADGPGGGIFTFGAGGTNEFKGTIVAGNTSVNFASDNCDVSPTSQGNNLAGDNSCNFDQPTDRNNTDPNLGLLQNNGGPTDTRALLAGSPAIDAGPDTGCPATDQRGGARPADGDDNGSAVCDIGAFELAAAGVPPPSDDGCTIRGTEGDDILPGTSGGDTICGYGGDDTIDARGGDDTIKGGAGNDTLVGGTGGDKLYGEAGDDRLNTKDGVRRNDLADGGTGTDTCVVDKKKKKKDRKVGCER